eukprot:CAMPEP_0175557734 /NCGR_PEP_ID=MMETSP0096-20121207/35528_1 /TAXON_ID=311494 /ORGANISM="Alexandrium monilatum, Strain CCMP3105" /LENGTH=298 /DNA_ID=CAMNT_0016860893 /DNA_START=1 /DNA_END=897 /DNA_ORIENTATION=+
MMLARSWRALPRLAGVAQPRLCASAAAEPVPRAVDVERYPIHDVELRRPMVERFRREIAQSGYCHMPGFLRREAVDQLISEATTLVAAGRGFRSHEAHNVFLEGGEGSANLEPGALRAQEFASSKLLVAMDDMAVDSKLLEVYRWDPLRSFLQMVFDLPQLHHSADPVGGVYYNIFDGGFHDTLGWHFDRSNFSMNLILQTTPGAGGDFQYVRDSRPEIAEMRQWTDVEDYIQPRIETPELFPGSLYLFAGSRSIHRVSPVTNGQRINAIFTYVEDEGARLNEYTLRKFFGRSGPRAA